MSDDDVDKSLARTRARIVMNCCCCCQQSVWLGVAGVIDEAEHAGEDVETAAGRAAASSGRAAGFLKTILCSLIAVGDVADCVRAQLDRSMEFFWHSCDVTEQYLRAKALAQFGFVLDEDAETVLARLNRKRTGGNVS